MIDLLKPKADGSLYEEHELPDAIDLPPGAILCVTYKKLVRVYKDNGRTYKVFGGAVRVYRGRHDV